MDNNTRRRDSHLDKFKSRYKTEGLLHNKQKKLNEKLFLKEESKFNATTLEEKSLKNKLKNVSDNNERSRIVESFMSQREKAINPNFDKDRGIAKDIQSKALKSEKGNAFNTVKDFVGPTTENKKTKAQSLKDRILGSKVGGLYSEFLKNISSDIPDSVRDLMTASSLGVQTKSTTLGKVGNLVGASEITGYNPITKDNINIDYLSNKVDTKKVDIKESDGFINKTFKNSYNGVADYFGARNLEKWKNMHREETSKSVRALGASIDPFDTGENLDYVRQQRLVEQIKGKMPAQNKYVSQPGVIQALNKEIPKLSNMYGNKDLPHLRARDESQLADINKRITSSKNNVKQFFNPVDKTELAALESTKAELTERIRRIDGNYGASRINGDPLKTPASVGESFKELNDRRFSITKQLDELGKDPTKSVYKERRRQALSNNLLDVDRELTTHNTDYKNSMAKVASSADLSSPMHTKDSYKPVYGTTGYGLGFSNSFKASRTEHLARGMHYLNPFGAGASSGLQALKESFGIMNHAQRTMANQSRGFAKVMNNSVPLIAAGVLLSGMNNYDDAGQIFEDMFAMGTSLHGWRTGTAFGAAAGGRAGGVGRLIGTGIGGLSGMALGYVAGSALVGGVRDIISNESNIRNFAKKASTKEAYVSQVATGQSLTARAASLNKLAKSGLNDRGLLLGNESTILATGG